jgi:Cdc6-like AAA superfamily ATPase
MEDKVTLPIEHLSYSSLNTFLSNQQQFKKNYILGIWDYKESPAAMVGKAFHKAMEMRYKGLDWDSSIQEGFKLIDEIQDSKIDFGKTGSREKIRKEYTQAIEFWRAEEPELGEVIETEAKITANFILPSGTPSPLPLKAVVDNIARLMTYLVIWDYKVVTAFSDPEKESAKRIIQAMFNYFTVKAKYGEAPKKMTYLEVKKSKNTDGSKQVQAYEIDFETMSFYFDLFERLYTGVVMQLADPNHLFLPNFDHPYSGEESWEDFVKEAVDMEMPTEVTHKTSLVQFVDKKAHYVQSSVEIGAENLKEHEKIIAKFLEFGIPLQFEEEFNGANVNLYTFKPSRGVKMKTIEAYGNDLALALEAKAVRIAAPLLGTKFVGVEVPNRKQRKLNFNQDLLITGTLNVPIGENIYGAIHHVDLSKAPHMLVAGTTGSGKSVFLNVAIKSLISQNTPDELTLVLIDPKRSEFTAFKSADHLFTDIITNKEDAMATLNWCVSEMERRYAKFESIEVKNYEEYVDHMGKVEPKIVIVIDELADLISNNAKDESANLIIRLAQKARAAGIHIIAATQRPSVDVVSGVMKANFPTRVAFLTSSRKDSEVILDEAGAEQLIGNGDLLLMDKSHRGLLRLQGYYL